MNLQGAVAIVTGAATGVGRASARALAAKKCHVLVGYSRSQTQADAVVADCEAQGAQALACHGDVASDEDCVRMVRTAVKRWGRVDVLINSAGTTKFVDHADLDGLDGDDFQRIFAVNVVGPFQMSRAAAPHMKARGEGAIVNISSMSGFVGDGSCIAYAASKGALNTMTKSLARTLAPEIRINAVCPEYIKGRWVLDGVGPERYEEIIQNAEERSRLGRVTTPDDIAETVLWLVEGAALITGECLNVDAGTSLG